MRLIDADALITDAFDLMDRNELLEDVPQIIKDYCDAQPTVDAIPIKWIEQYYGDEPAIYADMMIEAWNGDPNGFNEETVQALKDATERKNLSKVYETLDDMYADMGGSEWREYIYRERETSDGVDSDRMGELIRCRDCKRWNTKDGMFKDIDERQWHECPYLGVPTDEWFFCRDAERREDEN